MIALYPLFELNYLVIPSYQKDALFRDDRKEIFMLRPGDKTHKYKEGQIINIVNKRHKSMGLKIKINKLTPLKVKDLKNHNLNEDYVKKFIETYDLNENSRCTIIVFEKVTPTI